MINDYGYWIAIAHMKGWSYEDVNSLTVSVFHEQKSTWKDFFALTSAEQEALYRLTDKQLADIAEARETLGSNSFLAEDLLSQGYKIVPLNATEYPRSVKRVLGKRLSPPLLYSKGNQSLLNSTESLVVSAPGSATDKRNIDEALEQGRSVVVVLSHGITKFRVGFKDFYKHIISGKVVVISPFHPSLAYAKANDFVTKSVINSMYRSV